ncbi:hypothetical protein JKG47_22440 [Acidithiobacillus sp. MC6.1]|nr:hypothetical protein [Acidithiobacillus sp. MC6.1]
MSSRKTRLLMNFGYSPFRWSGICWWLEIRISVVHIAVLIFPIERARVDRGGNQYTISTSILYDLIWKHLHDNRSDALV